MSDWSTSREQEGQAIHRCAPAPSGALRRALSWIPLCFFRCASNHAALIAAVSIDEGTEKMLGAFFRPFNEALLKMSGGEPCDWQR